MRESVFNFHRDDADSLILVTARANQERATLALDTGATHTVIDLTVLLMAGYTIGDILRTVPMETAKGSIEAYVFKLSKLTCLGLTVTDKEVCSYHFLANNVLTAIDGVLGLDFFEACRLSIDFVDNTISILKKH